MAPNDLSVGGKNGPDAGSHQARNGAESDPKASLRRDVYRIFRFRGSQQLPTIVGILKGSLTILRLRLTKALNNAVAFEEG